MKNKDCRKSKLIFGGSGCGKVYINYDKFIGDSRLLWVSWISSANSFDTINISLQMRKNYYRNFFIKFAFIFINIFIKIYKII